MDIDSIEKYLSKVECRYCGSDVYSSQEPRYGDCEAREVAKQWIEEGVVTIDVRDRVSRECDGCRRFPDKDD